MSDRVDSGLVLVVDDEIDVCFLLKKLLSRYGYGVVCHHSLKETLDDLKNDKKAYDIVLLDINLKDGNGLSLLENKTIPESARVVVMSAQTHLRDRALHLGASDFISKPYSPESVMNAIEPDRMTG